MQAAAAYGIEVGWDITESSASLEAEIAPDSGGSPDTANSHTEFFAPGTIKQTFLFSPDGLRRHFRVRHVRDGVTSAWTRWVSGVPTEIGGKTQSTIVAANVFWKGDSTFLKVFPGPACQSIKYATSLSSQPDPETGTCADVTPKIPTVIDLGLSAEFADDAYVTITPYSEDSCAGAAGSPYRIKAQANWPKRYKWPHGAEDLIADLNGDFEQGWAHWNTTDGANTALETVSPYKGGTSMKITSKTAGGNMLVQLDERPDDVEHALTAARLIKIRVHPGDIIRVRGAMKISDANQIGRISLHTWDEDQVEIGFTAVVVTQTSDTSFTEREGTFTVPAGTYYVTPTLVAVQASASGDVWFDEIHVWRIKQVPDLSITEDIDLGGDVYVPDTKTVKVGTIATASNLSKTVRVPAAHLVPSSDLENWNLTVTGYVDPRLVQSYSGYGLFILPKGVTITGFRSRHYRAATGDTAVAKLYRVTDTGGGGAPIATALATLTHSTTGWQTNEDVTLSQLVGDEMYVLEVSLTSTSAGDDARHLWAELDYDMPSYDKGI